jgi:hypothetical protein
MKKFNELKGEFLNTKEADDHINSALAVMFNKKTSLEVNKENGKRITKITFSKTGYDSYFFDYKKDTQRWLMNVFISKESESEKIKVKIEYPIDIVL